MPPRSSLPRLSRLPPPIPPSPLFALAPVQRRALSLSPPRPTKLNRFSRHPPSEPILRPFQREVLVTHDPRRSGALHSGGGPGGGGRGGGGRGAGGGWWSGLDGRTKLVVVGAAGAGTYYVVHLERVPETGRLRFMDTSPSSEAAIGLQTYQETVSEYSQLLLPPNHKTTAYVREVARRIIEANGLGRMKGSSPSVSSLSSLFAGGGEEEGKREGGETEWEVFVIDDPKTRNAFVVPGGKIFVFTGLLPVCDNRDGLASVLGHEVAHQVARHSAERMSSLKVLMALGFVLEALGLDIGISRILLTFLLTLPNSRKSEKEADFIGLNLMSKACFDPREAPRMWERMASAEGAPSSSFPGAANVDFASTHPANGKRITSIENWLPEALALRASSDCADTQSRFEALGREVSLPDGRGARAFGGERMGGW